MSLNGFNYSISWSDFSQIPSRPTGETEDAQIHPEISFDNFTLARKKNAIVISAVDVKIGFAQYDCWVVKSLETDPLLVHEQGHYDIVALSARELYNSLRKLSAPSREKLQEQATKLSARLNTILQKKNRDYDSQTVHSRNKAQQKTWNEKIKAAKTNPNGTIQSLP